jgi:hypothetical protein
MKKSTRIRIAAAVIGGTGVAAVFGSAYLYHERFGGVLATDDTHWEAFGGYLGGVAGTIIGLVTLCTLAITWAQQVGDSEEASYAQHRQAFDSTFFRLLSRFSEIANSVHALQNEGRSAFRALYNSMGWPVGQNADVRAAIADMHRLMYLPNEPELGPYFRTLYHVFKFIDEDRVLIEDDKIEYANIARAQLSKYELLMMFYNCLTDYGTKFKPLIERYGLLKHINKAELRHLGHKTDPTLYASTAFMSEEQRKERRAHN